ncbi:MAG: DUF1993 domain-containing protein [Alphaproteobacteria bacterium]|nr:DUF1993 domain-containing protein [Alphaproteobacteria bacterium]
MTFSIYDASIPVYRRRLEALSAILTKADAYAAERKIDPAVLIGSRLYPDMLPFSAQVRIACGHALRGAARLQGIEPAAIEGEANTFADLQAWIGKTLEILGDIDAGTLAGSEDRMITFPTGGRTETLSGADYLLHFSLPNFYFHITTAYAILRHNGLDIGKGDFMGDK